LTTPVTDAQDNAHDVGGWEVYGEDWRHYFECMLSPQARQALPALEKLDLVPGPAQPLDQQGRVFSPLW